MCLAGWFMTTSVLHLQRWRIDAVCQHHRYYLWGTTQPTLSWRGDNSQVGRYARAHWWWNSGERGSTICCPHPAKMPHHSTKKLSPVYVTENMERVGCKITKIPVKSLCAPRVPARWGEKWNKGISADEPDSTTHTGTSWSPLHHDPYRVAKPHPSRGQPPGQLH